MVKADYSHSKWLTLAARVLAYVEDWTLQFGLIFGLLKLISGVSSYDVVHWNPTEIPPINLVFRLAFHILVTGIYLVLCTCIFGGTIGMWTWGLRMFDVNTGKQPRVRQVALRHLLSYASVIFFGVGYIYALSDPKGATWHDLKSDIIVLPYKE
jgi:uncharacterized RDD family membrane protein YckC